MTNSIPRKFPLFHSCQLSRIARDSPGKVCCVPRPGCKAALSRLFKVFNPQQKNTPDISLSCYLYGLHVSFSFTYNHLTYLANKFNRSNASEGQQALKRQSCVVDRHFAQTPPFCHYSNAPSTKSTNVIRR